jgi:regulator of nonsense transcripts 1
VIAAFVQLAVRFNKGGIWLVAQSNVAVKNIAEKLTSIGFENWKLLVSKGFHLGWHEHLYYKVQNNIVCSDTFNIASSKSNLKGCQIILCTLSMLSHPRINKFTKEIPLKIMVVDEASQIEVGNYVSIFANFKHSLRKLCFIGDDKQLPPFGQEDLQDLQSIFEIPHLRKQVVFLNIQYRMPPQIGDIISDLVYENKLKSNPLHPITEDTTACYFVEALGMEKPLPGGSYMNEVEATHVLHLARKLQDQERNYRIITGYEGQRSYIEGLMKDEGLEWGDKCFNVDSFQGNEEDFIIISIVRTLHLGFLSDLRRTNVMLSRCKKGMFMVSTPHFLTKIAKDSLIGQFVKKVSNPTWLTLEDIQGEKFWENEF